MFRSLTTWIYVSYPLQSHTIDIAQQSHTNVLHYAVQVPPSLGTPMLNTMAETLSSVTAIPLPTAANSTIRRTSRSTAKTLPLGPLSSEMQGKGVQGGINQAPHAQALIRMQEGSRVVTCMAGNRCSHRVLRWSPGPLKVGQCIATTRSSPTGHL